MSDIHFHIFFGYFVKRCVWHLIYLLERRIEKLYIRKLKSSLGDVFGPDLSCEIIQSTKQIGMNLL